jgi:hypothetical protein
MNAMRAGRHSPVQQQLSFKSKITEKKQKNEKKTIERQVCQDSFLRSD